MSFPVFKLKILISLSRSKIAAKLPCGLKLKEKGADPADRSCKKSVWILHLYERWVGKSNVEGSHISTNALSSIEKHTFKSQFILMNFIGCLWNAIVLTT